MGGGEEGGWCGGPAEGLEGHSQTQSICLSSWVVPAWSCCCQVCQACQAARLLPVTSPRASSLALSRPSTTPPTQGWPTKAPVARVILANVAPQGKYGVARYGTDRWTRATNGRCEPAVGRYELLQTRWPWNGQHGFHLLDEEDESLLYFDACCKEYDMRKMMYMVCIMYII